MGALLLPRQGRASACHLPAHPWHGRFGLNQGQTRSAWGGEGDATACARPWAPLWAPSQGAGPLCVSALLRGHWNSEPGLGRKAGGVTRILKGKGVSRHRARGGAVPSPGPSWSVRHHGSVSGQGLCAEGQGPDEYLFSVGRSCFCDGTDGRCPCGRRGGPRSPQGPRAGMATGHSAR